MSFKLLDGENGHLDQYLAGSINFDVSLHERPNVLSSLFGGSVGADLLQRSANGSVILV